MSLAFLFHYFMLSMFRMLTHPSSGACDLFVELFHGLYCSGMMCVGVTVWFGWGGVVSGCILLYHYYYIVIYFTWIHNNICSEHGNSGLLYRLDYTIYDKSLAPDHCGTWKFYCVCPLLFKIIIFKNCSLVGCEAMLYGRKFLMVHKSLMLPPIGDGGTDCCNTNSFLRDYTASHARRSCTHCHCHTNLMPQTIITFSLCPLLSF